MEKLKVELIGESLRKNKGCLELRRLEAACDIATILSQSQNKVMLDSQSLLLNGEHFAVNIITFFLFGNAVAGKEASDLLKVKK